MSKISKLIEKGAKFGSKLTSKVFGKSGKVVKPTIKSTTKALGKTAKVAAKSGKSLIKQTTKIISKALKPLFIGTAAAIPWLYNKLLGNNQQKNSDQNQQLAENAVIPEIEQSTSKQSIPNSVNESNQSQLGLSKDESNLNANKASKAASISKAASKSYNNAKTEVSSVLSSLETSGIAAKEITKRIHEIVEIKDKPSKLDSAVENEVKSKGLGVIALQHLFGKVDGIKESVIQVGKMLYDAQDVQIKQNNEQIKHLAELQKLIKSQAKIDGAQTTSDLIEKQINVEKDKLEADNARKLKSAADKAYEEATNANAESKLLESKLNKGLAVNRLNNVKERLQKSFKPSKASKLGVGLLGAAALVGGLKKLFDGPKDEDIDDENETSKESNIETDNDKKLEDFTDNNGNKYIVDEEGKGYLDNKGNHFNVNNKGELTLDKFANPWVNAGYKSMDWVGNNADDIYTGYLGMQGLKAPWYIAKGKMQKDALSHASKQVSKAIGKKGVAEADKVLLKELEQELLKAQEKAAAKQLSKSAEKEIMKKVIAKLGAKSTVSKIPGIGLLVNATFAADDWRNGDYTGAVLNLLSGIAAIVPGYGTALSYVLDGINCLVHLEKQHSAEWVRSHQGGGASISTYKQAKDASIEFESNSNGLSNVKQIAVRDAIPDTKSYWENQHDQSTSLPKSLTKKAKGYSTGGIVPGNPSDGDSVPALLQPGEFVMPIDLVTRLVNVLESNGSEKGSSEVSIKAPKIITHPQVIKPTPQPPIVRDTSLNPKDFENSIINKNFDIASAVGVANELPNYDLASGEDSNKHKDPLEASIRGICARYIRAALEAGGINTQNHPGEAYEYAKWLPNQGFRSIDNNSKLLPGDISVEDKTEKSPHGHISMWTGTQWVSDKFQNSRVVTPPGEHGKLTLLRHNSMPLTEPQDNTDYGKDDYDYGVDNVTAATSMDLQDALNNIPSDVQSIVANSPQSQQDFVNKLRGLLVNTMRNKSFINPHDIDLYADIMTAQVANETGWGKHIPGGGKSNNWSGMTPGTTRNSRKSTGVIHSAATGDYNKYVMFDSMEDWADEFVEYLNRKWDAFSKGPNEYLNQLERNPKHDGQRYGGYSAEEYIKAVTGCLPRVRALSINSGPVDSNVITKRMGGWFNDYLDKISASLYKPREQVATPGFNGEYGPRGQWKPKTSNPDDGKYYPNRGSQDKQVSVGPPNNFPDKGNVTLEYRIQGTEQGHGGPGTYGQLFINGKYFSDAHRTLANGAERNVGRTVPIQWNPSGKIMNTIPSSDNWKSYRENYIREKYGDQAVRQGRMPGMNEGTGTGGNRIHPGTDSSWSEGCLVVGYNDKGKTKMNTTDSFATWWSLYQGLDTLDKNGGKAQLKMTDERSNNKNKVSTSHRSLIDAGDDPNSLVSSPVNHSVPRVTADMGSTQISQPKLPTPEIPDDITTNEVSDSSKSTNNSNRSPIILAPQTNNNGGNTTINNNTVNNYNIHHDDAAKAEII